MPYQGFNLHLKKILMTVRVHIFFFVSRYSKGRRKDKTIFERGSEER